MKVLQNKVAVVTGSSSGIGAATAIAFAQAGLKVVVTGRNAEGLAKTAAVCRDAGAEVLVVEADLDIFENIESLIQQTVQKFSSIDILVNNAGKGTLCPIEHLPLENYEEDFRLNVRAPVFLCKYALPYLKKAKGCVVNVSSVMALRCYPNSVSYCMTKAALDHFTRGFAAECAQFGVRVNSINPGVVATNMKHRGVDLSTEAMGEIRAKYVKQQKLGMVQPEQVADAIIHLCTSSHITGSTLVIDGGLLLP